MKNELKKKLGEDFYNLLNHGKNYVTADVLSKGLTFLSVPIFVSLLTVEEYGLVAIFNSFIAVFGIVFGLGIRGAIGRYYYEKVNDFKEYLGSNLIFVLIWGIFFSTLLFLFRSFLSDFFKISTALVFIGILVAFFSSIFEIMLSYFEAAKKSILFSKISVTRSIGFLVLALPLTYYLTSDKEYGQIIAQLIIYFIVFIYSCYYIKKISTQSFNKTHIKFSLIFGIPLVFHLLSQYVLASFDQVIINQIVGEKETGIYSFAYQVGIIQNIITMGVLRAWNPVFYEKMNDELFDDINQLIRKYSKLIYLLAIFLIFFSKEIVLVLADERYFSSIKIIPPIIISYVFFFLYTIYVNYAFYFKKTYMIAVFTIIAGVINISLNYILIPKYGYEVAAITTLISYVSLFILHYFNTKFLLKPKKVISLKVVIPNLLLFLSFVIFYHFSMNNINNHLLEISYKIILVLAFITCTYFKDLKKIVNGRG